MLQIYAEAEKRVTQKSMTFKGHPFLFGLLRVVTMRE